MIVVVISAHIWRILQYAGPGTSLALHNYTGENDNSKVRRNT